ncbi:MAG TPA: hypothetical protein VGL61_14215 [Kofleriaceae bacterium]|jgi:hypothetical protein
MTCIGEPISWLRLERHALAPDAAIAEHVAACAACRQCLDEIARDVVALPPLAVPERRRWSLRWLRIALPALAAAAIAIVVLRPKPEPRPRGELLAGVKGVGDVAVSLVRERAGAIAEDAATFSPGDRWKVVITCASASGAWIDVAVTEAGSSAADHPIAPVHVACGNGVAIPGAFEVTGTRTNEICVRVWARPGELGDRACMTVLPEAR